jgi:uncharacterized membrane protein
MLKNLGFQEYLSIGYLYLVILGVVSESIFYKMLGINILYFASLSDILTAPLTLLMSHWLIPVTILGMVLLLVLVNKLSEKFNAKHDKEQAMNLLILCTGLIFLVFLLGSNWEEAPSKRVLFPKVKLSLITKLLLMMDKSRK